MTFVTRKVIRVKIAVRSAFHSDRILRQRPSTITCEDATRSSSDIGMMVVAGVVSASRKQATSTQKPRRRARRSCMWHLSGKMARTRQIGRPCHRLDAGTSDRGCDLARIRHEPHVTPIDPNPQTPKCQRKRRRGCGAFERTTETKGLRTTWAEASTRRRSRHHPSQPLRER
jgi:hypothetical protein